MPKQGLSENTIDNFYSPSFYMLCGANFLFSASFSMLLPELPSYLSKLGGADYKGYIIALFTLTAGISRPVSGKLTDTIGRLPVIFLGGVICLFCGFLYPLLITVTGFLCLRLFHGFSTGFTPTGITAYIADMVPPHRRGEAMGALGISASIGMSAGPILGSYIAIIWSINALFIASSVVAILVLACTMFLKETLHERQKFRWGLLKINKDEVFEKAVTSPFIVMFLVSFATGTILTITPDFSDYLHIPNKGWVYAAYTLAALATRMFAARSSDNYGRVPVLRFSMLVMAVGLAIMAFAKTATVLVFGVVFYGISWGLNTPILQAWTVDLSPKFKIGISLATVYIALEAGIGFGALITGFLYQNSPTRFTICFLVPALLAIFAFGYLSVFKRIETI